MYDAGDADPRTLDLAQRVVGDLLRGAPEVAPSRLMLVGAVCRDVIHSALGHTTVLRATSDIDIAVAVDSWESYVALTRGRPRLGDTGIRFKVADCPTDIVPFGPVEAPTGEVVPPSRGEPLSVWAFEEVREASLGLALPGAGAVRIPSIPGFLSLKLAAWLDRSARGEFRDAREVAVSLWWYASAAAVHETLWPHSSWASR